MHAVKNISDPVHVFSLVLDDKAAAIVSPIAPVAETIKALAVRRME